MQNPEVWSFHEPQSQFKIQELDAYNIPTKHIQPFYFNHLVCVVLPDCVRIPENLTSLLSDDCQYYKILNLNLSKLLNSAFISNFVTRGKLTILSIGTRIDCDNCCALTPLGKLILSLTKDTYQALGLEGKPSQFTKGNKDRYIVRIDLTDSKLIPEKPYYERIKSALESLESFTVIVTWEPPEEPVCPSSVAKFFQEVNCEVLECEPSHRSHVVSLEKIPTLEECIEEPNIIHFVEWLGMVSIDADLTGSAENYVNSYETPEPNADMGLVRVIVWRGFYQHNQIQKLIDFLREYTNIEGKAWTSLYVQGFSDAPIIESSTEQNYFTNGDNGNVFIFNKDKSWYCKQRCCHKRYRRN